MKFYFHPDAEAEFDTAVEYYEQFQEGLGLEFAEEIYATISRIIQYLLMGLWFVLVLSSMVSAEALSATSRDIAECAKIEDDAERLKCYDNLARPKSGNIVPADKPAEKAQEDQEGQGKQVSYFSRLWEMDEETRRGQFAITPHRSNYILPFTYNTSPNVAAVRESDPDKDVKNAAH